MSGADDWVKAGFAVVWPTHTAEFARLMIFLRKAFDGDLDRMLILAVIGERALARRACTTEPSFEHLGRTTLRDPLELAINSHSLAEYTGIPRETVRRKVAALVDRGWVERDASGDLRPTEKAAVDLAGSTDATVTYLRAIASALDAARRSAPSANPTTDGPVQG